MEYAIELLGLTKSFRIRGSQSEGELCVLKSVGRLLSRTKANGTILAVNDVSLKVREGELFGLLGPNGAGKTTLVKTLCTLLWPNAGTAIVNGYDIRREPKRVRAAVGTVLDVQMGWYGRLSCRQNMLFYARLHGMHPERIGESISSVLKLVGLSEKSEEWEQKLSSGMRRRLDMARALLPDPPILLLDEPTLGLDVESSRGLRQLIGRELCCRQRKTVLLTTHNMDEAEQICDRIAVMHKGKIVAMGDADHIKGLVKSSESVACEVEGITPQILSSIEKMEGVASVAAYPKGLGMNELRIDVVERGIVPRISQAIVRGGGLLHMIRLEQPSLEDALIKLTSEG